MDHLKSIQQAIDYIEDNLTESVSPSDVAREAAYSLFHFHRLFGMLVGDSVMGYIRKRRLSEAACRLVHSEYSILNIAVEYGYETQESFTRAFRNAYGSSPGEYRRRGLYRPLVPKLVLSQQIHRDHGGGTMKGPKIVERGEFTIVGMEYFGRNENMEISELWTKLLPVMCEIPNPSEHGTAYGICHSSNEDGEFAYLAGIAVKDESQVPEGMKSMKIPAGKYAVFTHTGSRETLNDTYSYIYTKWAAESGNELLGFDFELYDERFKDFSSDSEMDIYIPIK